jgi:hypothetical protein
MNKKHEDVLGAWKVIKGFIARLSFSIHKLVSPRLSRIVNSVWRKAGNTNEQLKVGNALGTTGR